MKFFRARGRSHPKRNTQNSEEGCYFIQAGGLSCKVCLSILLKKKEHAIFLLCVTYITKICFVKDPDEKAFQNIIGKEDNIFSAYYNGVFYNLH